MISQMVGGPAAGKTFSTRRAPMYLRVVFDRRAQEWDVLDQPDDTPIEDEDVHVYAAVPETWTFGFVRPGGRYEGAIYQHRPDVDGEELRSTNGWRVWAEGQPPIEMLSPGMKKVLEEGAERRRRYTGRERAR